MAFSARPPNVAWRGALSAVLVADVASIGLLGVDATVAHGPGAAGQYHGDKGDDGEGDGHQDELVL